MAVKKTIRECYEVRQDKPHGEWANITLATWSRNTQNGIYHCGEIQIHSSYGNWAYTWTACGSPFKKFLQEIEFDYAFTKFMGTNLEEFDGEKTLKRFRQRLLSDRRNDWVDKDTARLIWDRLRECEEELTRSSDGWVHAMGELIERDYYPTRAQLAAERFCSEPWEFIETSPKPGPVHFWKELWPLFIRTLQEETA